MGAQGGEGPVLVAEEGQAGGGCGRYLRRGRYAAGGEHDHLPTNLLAGLRFSYRWCCASSSAFPSRARAAGSAAAPPRWRSGRASAMASRSGGWRCTRTTTAVPITTRTMRARGRPRTPAARGRSPTPSASAVRPLPPCLPRWPAARLNTALSSCVAQWSSRTRRAKCAARPRGRWGRATRTCTTACCRPTRWTRRPAPLWTGRSTLG